MKIVLMEDDSIFADDWENFNKQFVLLIVSDNIQSIFSVVNADG